MWITVPEVHQTSAAYDSQVEYIMYSNSLDVKKHILAVTIPSLPLEEAEATAPLAPTLTA